MSPEELRRRGREQLEPYGTIDFREATVTEIRKLPQGGFVVAAEKQPPVQTRFVLLALGMIDVALDIPGYETFWGTSVFHCPHCHAWELRDQPLGVLARHPDLLAMGPRLLSWSRDITVFVGPQVKVPAEFAAKAEALGLRIETRRVQSLRGSRETGMLSAVELQGGTRIRCAGLFYRPEQRQCELVRALGLKLTAGGFVEVDESKQTSIPGIYAAGDLTTDYQQIAEAVVQGHRAAFSIELALKDA